MLIASGINKYLMHASWSFPALGIIGVVFVIVVFGPWFGELEGEWSPVTSKVEISDVSETPDGTLFRMTFAKLKNCTLRGITVRRLGVSVPAGPAPGQPGGNGTLALGERRSQLWLVPGSPPLDDMEIVFSHSCGGGFWTVLTHAYP